MKLRFKLVLLILFIIMTASCSGKRIGYVVMLWPPEDVKAETGEIIKIISQSDIRNVYVIEKKAEKYRAEIPRSSGRFFKKKKEAEVFAAEFEVFKDTYSYSEKSIPVRKEADPSSQRIYKLRPSQIIKVVGKNEETVTIGNLTGHWFRVLTEDGFEGYCFDKYLKFFELDTEHIEKNKEKNWLNDLYDNKWYPVKYREVVESGRIVISQIKTGEGLFIDRDKKQFVIQTEQDRIEFYYESITRIDERRYFFEGTPIEINFYPNDSINIKYVYQGIDYSTFYSLLEMSIDEYVSGELMRRDDIYNELIEKGKYLTSDLYGSIVLKDDRSYIWTGYVNLVPDIIPFGYGITGKVENHYYLSGSLSRNYDGILSFVFERNSEEVSFVYYMTDEEGLELIYLPPDYIEEDFVKELPEKKKIYYFRQGITLEESQGFGRNDDEIGDTAESGSSGSGNTGNSFSSSTENNISSEPVSEDETMSDQGSMNADLLPGSTIIPGSTNVLIPEGSLES